MTAHVPIAPPLRRIAMWRESGATGRQYDRTVRSRETIQSQSRAAETPICNWRESEGARTNYGAVLLMRQIVRDDCPAG